MVVVQCLRASHVRWKTVSTLNGRGTPGFADGPAGLFNTPKGVAIDNAGFVWVVDQGNHVIRRIQMATGEARTVAGSPGQAGNRDGVGSAARFDTPTGIAIEPESLVEQLLREGLLAWRRDDPALPPAIREYIEKMGGYALLRVPLRVADQFLGYLSLWESRRPRLWQEREHARVDFRA